MLSQRRPSSQSQCRRGDVTGTAGSQANRGCGRESPNSRRQSSTGVG